MFLLQSNVYVNDARRWFQFKPGRFIFLQRGSMKQARQNGTNSAVRKHKCWF